MGEKKQNNDFLLQNVKKWYVLEMWLQTDSVLFTHACRIAKPSEKWSDRQKIQENQYTAYFHTEHETERKKNVMKSLIVHWFQQI